jgi:hypothetical protein
MLTNCSPLTSSASQALHYTCGYAEQLDPRYAQICYRRAQQELFRCEKYGKLIPGERVALHADAQFWHDRIEPLEYLADLQGYAAVNPLRPHWQGYRLPQCAPHT